MSEGERHPPSTQTVTHTRKERETNKNTHAVCVGVSGAQCQRHTTHPHTQTHRVCGDVGVGWEVSQSEGG